MTVQINTDIVKKKDFKGKVNPSFSNPYMSATDRALSNGESIFNVAKSSSENSNSAEISKCESLADDASNKTDYCKNTGLKLQQDQKDVDASVKQAETKNKETNSIIKSDSNKLLSLSKEGKQIDEEIKALESERNTLSNEEDSSNPFERIYSLDIGAPDNQTSDSNKPGTTVQTAQSNENNPNQERLNEIDTKLGYLSGKKAAVNKKMDTTYKHMDGVSKNNLKYLAATKSKAQKTLQNAKANQNEANIFAGIAATTTTVGGLATAAGTGLCAISQFEIGIPMQYAGGTATAAGSGLIAAAHTFNGRINDALISTTNGINGLNSFSNIKKPELDKPPVKTA